MVEKKEFYSEKDQRRYLNFLYGSKKEKEGEEKIRLL